MKPTDKDVKGTTTVGFVCKDGVVLATDQLDDKIGATIAGTVSHAQSLMDVIKAEISLYKLKNEKEV